MVGWIESMPKPPTVATNAVSIAGGDSNGVMKVTLTIEASEELRSGFAAYIGCRYQFQFVAKVVKVTP